MKQYYIHKGTGKLLKISYYNYIVVLENNKEYDEYAYILHAHTC